MLGDITGSCSEIGCWLGRLPRGCELCMDGLKSVIFVTGLCSDKCFYCPISLTKRRKDQMFVNEVLVSDAKDLISEVVVSGSRGAGLTGGDPLIRLDKTLNVIKVLKEFFGNSFHIHLYTTGSLLTEDVIRKLVDVGLDELRIHIISERSWLAIKTALKYPITVGIENPVIPGEFEYLKSVIVRAYEAGVEFINLNELEFSESNYLSLRLRGLKPKPGSVAVDGSEDLALKLLEWVKDSGLDINVHYCPAMFKDRYQYVRRLSRRALNSKRVFEEVGEGLVKWAVLKSCPEEVVNALVLTDQAILIDNEVATSARLARILRCKYYIIEALPLTPRKILNRI